MSCLGHAAESWVQSQGFIRKEEYYHFDSVLQEQLRKSDGEQLLIEVESLMSGVKEESLI